jgi:hypothetical protein
LLREEAALAGHSRAAGESAATAAELAALQARLDGSAKRVRALETENGELRRGKAQAAADLCLVQELLADSDAERRCVCVMC